MEPICFEMPEESCIPGTGCVLEAGWEGRRQTGEVAAAAAVAEEGGSGFKFSSGVFLSLREGVAWGGRLVPSETLGRVGGWGNGDVAAAAAIFRLPLGPPV